MDKNGFVNKVLWGVFVVAIAATMVYAYTWTLISSKPVNSCSDSDGGLQGKIFGSVSGLDLNNKTYNVTDACSNTTILYESACSVGTKQVWSTNCNNMTENTTTCSSGRCV